MSSDVTFKMRFCLFGIRFLSVAQRPDSLPLFTFFRFEDEKRIEKQILIDDGVTSRQLAR